MALSIEIRNDEVYIVEAKVTINKVSIKKMHMFPFPDKYVDFMGIRNKEDFSALLKQNLDELGTKEKSCIICMNNSSIIYREIFLPKVDSKKLPLLVRNEMISVLNLTPNYVMDFVILEEVSVEEDPMYRILAVAVLEEVIESYLETFRKVGLKVDIIDSATNAVIKFLDLSGVSKMQGQMIVADMGKGNLRLYLFDQGLYVLSRNTKLPAYGQDDKQLVIDLIQENINKMIQFSQTRNKKEISKILLMGLDDLLEDVKKSTVENLKVSCDVFGDVLTHRSIQGFKNQYVNTIGVMLRK